MPGIPPAKFVGWLVTLPLSLQGGPSVPGKDYVYIKFNVLPWYYLLTTKRSFKFGNVFPEQMGYPEVPLLLGQSDSSAEWLT